MKYNKIISLIMLIACLASLSACNISETKSVFLGLDSELHFGMTKKEVSKYIEKCDLQSNSSFSGIYDVFWDDRFRGNISLNYDGNGELTKLTIAIRNEDMQSDSVEAIAKKIVEKYGNPNEYEELPVDGIISRAKWNCENYVVACTINKGEKRDTEKVILIWDKNEPLLSSDKVELPSSGLKTHLEPGEDLYQVYNVLSFGSIDLSGGMSEDSLSYSLTIKNQAEFPVDDIRYTVVALDSDHNVLKTTEDYIKTRLKPEERRDEKGFIFENNILRKVQKCEVTAYSYIYDGFRHFISGESYSKEAAVIPDQVNFNEGNIVEFVNLKESDLGNGDFKVGFEATNKSAKKIKNIKITVGFLDSRGNQLSYVSVGSRLFSKEYSFLNNDESKVKNQNESWNIEVSSHSFSRTDISSTEIIDYEYEIENGDIGGYKRLKVNLQTGTVTGTNLEYATH